MDVNEQIEKFKDFIETTYKNNLYEAIQQGKRSLVLDFRELARSEPELSEALLQNPEEAVKSAEYALDQMDLPEETAQIRIRFNNLPPTQRLRIADIRSEHLNRLVWMEGIVRQTSDVRPQVTKAKFECGGCNNTLSILQIDSKFKEPTRCTCGWRGKFRLLDKELIDVQHVKIEEAPENLEGAEQPKRLSIFLSEDLVDPKMERKVTAGNKVRIFGSIKEIPIPLKTGAQSTRYDIILEGNNIETVQEDYSDIKVTAEDEAKIKELSKDPQAFEKFARSVAPSIFGYERVKEALILQLFGGVRKVRDDGTATRGDIHILLVGDPGAGKSAMLQFISKAAPKARFVSGKGASGAGLTATVVKDEFLRGWALEAGALVLANKGLAVVDELDKMTDEDRSALHEGMEQQSYPPDFKIMLSDGTTQKIGLFVDQLIESNKNKVIRGKDCEILNTQDYEVLTTDFNTVYPTKIDRVSRHIAPDHFIEVEFSNGRKVMVTPEHPFFVFTKEGYTEIPANELSLEMFIPAPRKLPCTSQLSQLEPVPIANYHKKITLPSTINNKFSRLLGYVVSEGYSYYNPKNHSAEIGVCNTNPNLAYEMDSLFNSTFQCYTNHDLTHPENKPNSTKTLSTIYCSSVPLYNYFKKNFTGLTLKSPQKSIPNSVRTLQNSLKLEFLRTAFKGDGFVDSERVGFSTSSFELACNYSDLLLMNGIWSYIATEHRSEKQYYKVVISGSYDSFLKLIVEPDDKRVEKIRALAQRSENKLNDRDLFLPVEELNTLLKEIKMSDGSLVSNLKRNQNIHVTTAKNHLSRIERRLNFVSTQTDPKTIRRRLNIQVSEIATALECSTGTIYHLEQRKDPGYISTLTSLKNQRLTTLRKKLEKLKSITNSDLRLVRVKSLKKIKNDGIKWVYDVTVEPNHTFISEGLVLHNTITISKANVQACLNAQTTLLAAANPKLGRFDPYSPIAAQIDLPPSLLNRFDLIFPIRDIPNKEKDERIALHVLEAAQQANLNYEAEITPEFLRKYLAYAKQHTFPIMTKAATTAIKDFYVSLRNSGKAEEGSVKPIPISARQLEALIRLSQASAKVRLDEKVTREDALRAINLLKSCLMEVGFDPETGQIDIDKMSSTITASARNKIHVIKEIVLSIESKGIKTIPIEQIIADAAVKGIEESKVYESIEQLKKSGDMFEPKKGFVQRI